MVEFNQCSLSVQRTGGFGSLSFIRGLNRRTRKKVYQNKEEEKGLTMRQAAPAGTEAIGKRFERATPSKERKYTKSQPIETPKGQRAMTIYHQKEGTSP